MWEALNKHFNIQHLRQDLVQTNSYLTELCDPYFTVTVSCNVCSSFIKPLEGIKNVQEKDHHRTKYTAYQKRSTTFKIQNR